MGGPHKKKPCPRCGRSIRVIYALCQRCSSARRKRMAKGRYDRCPGCGGRKCDTAKVCMACYLKQFGSQPHRCLDCGSPVYWTSSRCMSCENKRRWKLWRQSRCVHYWILDYANYGVCKLCDAHVTSPRRGDALGIDIDILEDVLTAGKVIGGI